VRYATSQNTNSPDIDYIIPIIDSTCFLSITFEVINGGSISYSSCVGGKRTEFFDVGVHTISNPNGIVNSITPITAEIKENSIVTGEACLRYKYPSDIEYYQVLTAITITQTPTPLGMTYTIPDLGNQPYGIWHELIQNNTGYFLQEVSGGGFRFKSNGSITPPPNPDFSYPTSIIDDFTSQKILILQRGVDPYSPMMPNTYGIGKILGHPTEESVVISAMTRMNVPIQAISNTTISVQDHKNVNEIFSGSYFYSPGIPNSPLFPNASTTPGLAFSSYTTSNIGYYGALDFTYYNNINKFIIDNKGNKYFGNGSQPTQTMNNYGISTWPNNKGVYVVTQSPTNNLFGDIKFPTFPFTGVINPSTSYQPLEDLSGAAYMYRGPFAKFDKRSAFQIAVGNPPDERYFLDDKGSAILNLYFSPLLLPQFTGTTGPTSKLLINNPPQQMVMRSDRLPSSDVFDVNVKKNDVSFLNNTVPLLQQNLSFAAYSVEGGGLSAGGASFSTGAQQVTADIEGQYASVNVLNTLSDCEKLVGLGGYSGNGVSFGVNSNYQGQGQVENGCYVFVDEPLIGLPGDLALFAEWGYRFRFNYGLCRGVLSQSFTNNWVNGSLYMFPIQADTQFDVLGNPTSEYARPLVFFDESTSTFYYRSSPFSLSSGKFVGKPPINNTSVNSRNLLFPTTIVNLGMKDSIYQEIIFDASAKGYIMKSLSPTTYSDTSDLVNLFVISRITSSGFLGNLLAGLNGALNILFSRNGRNYRIDGDLAQSMSINSEYGVIPFSPQYYKVTGNISDPVVVLGTLENPTMGIFFSSSTIDLQNKDFLSPGIIDFRFPNNPKNAVTYPYNIKSQYVPFYQWELNGGTSIFGTETNNWATNQSNIFSQRYQSLSRRIQDTPNNPSYFMGSTVYPPAGPNVQPLGDIYQRGYIFGVNDNGGYAYDAATGVGNWEKNFLVGAPNHFYFGVIKGESALDKFKTKYSVDE
jgi:hypothetical protein